MDFVLTLHSHLPYVLNHGGWPHGSDWISEAAIDTYLPLLAHFRELEGAAVPAPVTIAFTPVLANQLAHPTFHRIGIGAHPEGRGWRLGRRVRRAVEPEPARLAPGHEPIRPDPCRTRKA